MEYAYSIWQIGIIALVAGILIGAMAYRLLGSSGEQADKIKFELDAAKMELDEYKASVNKHFNKTSELVSELTQGYVKVYQHLADGAQNLGDNGALTNLLEQHQGKVSIALENEGDATDDTPHNVIDESIEVPESPAEAVDEHAEPFAETNAGETNSANLKNDADKPKDSESASDSVEVAQEAEKVDAGVETAATESEAATPKVKTES